MLEIIRAIILGIVQGLTEFLPISSSGHLVFLQKLGVGEPSVFFNIMLHLGTLFASVLALWKPLMESIKSFDRVFKIGLACLPTILIAVIIKFFFAELLVGAILGVGFLITAVVLVLTDSLRQPLQDKEIDYKRSLLVGVMQGIAVLPGVSSSGMTIGFLRGTGVDGKKAAEFSFIIGMPVIFGGALFEMIAYDGVGDWSITAVIFGVIASFISGYFAIRLMIKVFAHRSLIPFAVYVLVMAIISFIAF